MSPVQLVYAALAIAGAVVPWMYNIEFMRLSDGFDVIAFVESGYVNPGAASLTSDLFIGASAVTLFTIVEARRLKMKWWGVYLVVTYAVAFACAAPLFLLMRERHLAAQA